MGQNEKCSWDDAKCARNIATHGYDFADVQEIFDGRFLITRQDARHDYGEFRYNSLVMFRDRLINVTFTPRRGKIHLISVRPASREERSFYHDKAESR